MNIVLQDFGETPQHMRSEYYVHIGVGFFNLLGNSRFLRHTAADADYLVAVCLFRVAERANVAEYTHFRVLSHGAGVYNYYIGVRLAVCHLTAHFREHAPEFFAVRLVLLTAVSVNKSLGGAGFSGKRAQFCHYFPLL